MQIFLSFPEIRQYIRKHYQQDIGVRFIDPRTVSLSYSLNRFVPTIHISLKIERFNTGHLILLYNSRRGINLIIRGLVAFMGDKIDKDMLEIIPGKRIIQVNLDKIAGIQKAFEHVNPENIFLDEDGLFLIFGIN